MTEIPLPRIPKPVRVTRDEHGIPQVVAATWTDALFGLGYMHAYDRGTQMLFARSVADGRASEEIADTPELRETDRFFRRVKLAQQLEHEVETMPLPLREQLNAYCDGVNCSLETSGRSLPMWATGFRPRRWNEESILLIGKLLSFGGLAVSQMQNERLLMELIHAGVSAGALQELFAPRLDEVDFEMLREVKMANQAVRRRARTDHRLTTVSGQQCLGGASCTQCHRRRAPRFGSPSGDQSPASDLV